jgi:hypothetical protein
MIATFHLVNGDKYEADAETSDRIKTVISANQIDATTIITLSGVSFPMTSVVKMTTRTDA